jgi:hypothetical protein
MPWASGYRARTACRAIHTCCRNSNVADPAWCILTTSIGDSECLGAHKQDIRPNSMCFSVFRVYCPAQSTRMGRLNTSLCRKVTTEYTHGDAKFLLDTPTLIASCPARTRWLVSMTHKYSGPIFFRILFIRLRSPGGKDTSWSMTTAAPFESV